LLIILVKVTASGCQVSDTSYTYFIQNLDNTTLHIREKERKIEIICFLVGLLLLLSKKIKQNMKSDAKKENTSTVRNT
jgi:hypothetical protein